MKIHNIYKALTIFLTIAIIFCGGYICKQHKQISEQHLKIENIENDLKEVKLKCEETELLYDEFYYMSNEINKVVKEENKIKTTDPRTLIKLACKELGVDEDLAIAISRAETANWTSDLYKQNNNVGGLTDGNTWFNYSTLLQGVNAYVINLKKNYIDLGLTTPELMGSKYCPENTSYWIELVNELIREEEYD